MIYLLCILTILLALGNYLLCKRDLLQPAFLLCVVFAACELVCVLAQRIFQITISSLTVAVITAGLLAFSAVNYLAYRRGCKKPDRYAPVTAVEISNVYVILLLAGQLLCIFFFVRYLGALAEGVRRFADQPENLHYTTLGEQIELYDTLTKFWPRVFKTISVPVPMFYRIANPVCEAAEYLVLYIAAKNFTARRRVNPLHLAVAALMVVRILLNGSRTPIFRMITFVAFLLILFFVTQGKKVKLRWKHLAWACGAVLALCVIMIGLGFVIRRGTDGYGILSYVFIYTGAPIVNLNSFLSSCVTETFGGLAEESLFAAQTLKNGYEYLAKWFPIRVSIPNIEQFAHSANGIEIGNVYTMFYKFIYDVGYIGVTVFPAIMALYYGFTYEAIKKKRSGRAVDLRMFFYAYLMNDLIMSVFSSRFYETIFSPVTLKLIPLTIVLDLCCIEHDLFGWIRRAIKEKRKPRELLQDLGAALRLKKHE